MKSLKLQQDFSYYIGNEYIEVAISEFFTVFIERARFLDDNVIEALEQYIKLFEHTNDSDHIDQSGDNQIVIELEQTSQFN